MTLMGLMFIGFLLGAIAGYGLGLAIGARDTERRWLDTVNRKDDRERASRRDGARWVSEDIFGSNTERK